MSYFKNSLIVDFTSVPARLDLYKIRGFVFKNMGLDMSMIKSLQVRVIQAQVVIEVESAVLAVELVTKHHLKHAVEHEGRLYRIPVCIADNIKQVQIHDLPSQMPDCLIVNFLSAYGEVISIANNVWKDVFTGTNDGVRIAWMRLKKPIPSFVKIEGMMCYIAYNGQTRTCKYCTFPVHIGKSCEQNRKDIVECDMTIERILQFSNPETAVPTEQSIVGETIISSTVTSQNQPITSTNPTVTAIPLSNCDQPSAADNSDTTSLISYAQDEDSFNRIESVSDDEPLSHYHSQINQPIVPPSCDSTNQLKPMKIIIERLNMVEQEKSSSTPKHSKATQQEGSYRIRPANFYKRRASYSSSD